jgi:hypothetical protein
MAPQTRKSHASTSSADIHAQTAHLVITLPDDLEPSTLDSLTGSITDWTSPTPETILSLYRLVVSQKVEFDNALQDWEQRLQQKDADLEQALQDQETYRRESTEGIELLRMEVERLKSAGTLVENERNSLAGQLASLTSSSSVSGREIEMLKHQVEEREREKKTLTDTLDATLNRETRLHGTYSSPPSFLFQKGSQSTSPPFQPKTPPSEKTHKPSDNKPRNSKQNWQRRVQ